MRVLVVVEGKHEANGAARALIQQIRSDLTDLSFHRLANAPVHVHGKGRGYFKKAVSWMRQAHRDGYDAIILLVDRDRMAARSAEITAAQDDHAICNIPRALGVPIEAFDAWMLADEQALSKVLGITVPQQPDPENIAHPKDHTEKLLAALGLPWGGAEMYARIAAELDISHLARRCPEGFATFADRVQKL